MNLSYWFILFWLPYDTSLSAALTAALPSALSAAPSATLSAVLVLPFKSFKDIVSHRFNAVLRLHQINRLSIRQSILNAFQSPSEVLDVQQTMAANVLM